MAEETTSIDLVRAALRAADAGDLDECRKYMHPALVVTIAGVPAPVEGREHWLAGVTAMATAFPDLHTAVNDAVSASGLIALRCTLTGTHQGPFNGIEATGRSIEVMSNDFYRVEDDLVVEGWIVTDTGTLFAQIS